MVPTGPYGSWPSPIDATVAASHGGAPQFVGVVGDEVWWTAPRPEEGGRQALVRLRPDGAEDVVLPAPWNVRSRVVEYGGQPWTGTAREADGPLVVFVNFSDQRLYAYEPDAPGGPRPRPLTPVSSVGGGLRWADPVLRGGEVWCVLEEFTGEAPTDVRRVIAAVPLDGSAAEDRAAVRELSDGRHRFVTGPRISPDGTQVAYIGWDHPRMPWDGTEVLVAEIPYGAREFTDTRCLAGGPEESVCQVEWDRDGTLLFSSDRGGWWELYRLRRDGHRISGALCLGREEEFGGPLWQVGQRWFHPLDTGLIAVVHGRGATALGILDPETGELVDAAGPWTTWAATLAVQGDRIIGVAASPRSGYEVVELCTATGRARVIGSPHDDPVDPAYYPEPLIRTFTGPEGRDIHAHIYPPHHPGRIAPAEELPPYVVWAHGGPTGHAPLVLDLEIAYFTSRGIGVAEVNYGGSTGYGREYRNRLRGQWGVVDVEDCAAVALALADEGTADRDRLAVRGGSAGGFTTAASLADTDIYACGTIKYPVLDLVSWADDETHDLESHYLESLVGPLATCQEVYAERSPHADRITVPSLLLQGLDDPVCPPVQAERFLGQMAGRGVPHAYLAFAGEGHGFRKAETIRRVLEAELSLYVQVFGIDRDDVPRLEFKK
ncbi:acyl-peptide hydrolase [Streptomyces spiroverticillatus]|uniref:Acyl-peptide hydrolase n=1 Tax=Streptomyces finlayi TaxID=67296 RepID=A0A918WZL6_9ACTN|nr:prolyl oligopeptidase family serine peptidase [Streptomyces finlayi]GHA13270.1 acyl-peptide hydrolase [Streptomyces spiroverticillatus]GHC98049.1 acyl-peptide hydrolase [Streptomyces finlayi]